MVDAQDSTRFRIFVVDPVENMRLPLSLYLEDLGHDLVMAAELSDCLYNVGRTEAGTCYQPTA